MDRYRVERITGSNMDALVTNLRALLNGLSEDEHCVTLSMGIREALVVIERTTGAVTIAAGQPTVQAPTADRPQTTPYSVQEPATPVQPMAHQAAPEAIAAMGEPATPEVVEEHPQTVQFIPKSRAETPESVGVRPPSPEPPIQPAAPAPAHPGLIFRKCSHCGNQLIVPHIPISVMCPQCKSTLTIEE